ncbi:MAG: hypoxanthine phosphoribosyltransferase [Candidatus Sumerlaeia bacterium]|nr:hypoxanthine phosphoribosyltransferase [Candidatus Sumerlaeia bacterium]
MGTISKNLDHDIEEVLFTEEQILKRVGEIGARISEDYAGRELVLVGILRGALTFLADLSRAITVPHSFDMVGASSYGSSTSSSGRVQITKDVEVTLRDKDVVIIEDIYDSGRTLAAIRDLLRVHHPSTISMATLLHKKVKNRAAELDIKYIGFELDDRFVVGYGLDFDEYYRNLKYIGVLSPRVYKDGGAVL